jgi:hypothetical protein
MNLFVVILLMNCVCLFGEKYTKKHLRGMHEEELIKLLMADLTLAIDNIKYKIIERAKTGINEYQFTIMCKKRRDGPRNCDYYDGHKEWLKANPLSILSICKTFTTREEFTTAIIDIVQDIFPDANITKSYKNCCDYYQIEW